MRLALLLSPSRGLLRWACTWLLTLLLAASAVAAPVYSFGVVPQFEARELASVWVPILESLSRRTGLRFEMKGSPRIPDFEVAFEHGDFDFAFMNPYHAYRAMATQGYVPLIRDGEPLSGILVVRKDSPYRSARDLAEKRIAFPAPNALGASLLLRAALDTVYGVKFVPVYAQTHTSAYLNTVLGLTQASGGVRSSLARQKAEVREQLRIIYETRSMPPHPVVAHPRVPAQHRLRVQRAFLDLAKSPDGAALLARIPMPRPVIPTLAEYRELGTWGLEKYLVKPGG